MAVQPPTLLTSLAANRGMNMGQLQFLTKEPEWRPGSFDAASPPARLPRTVSRVTVVSETPMDVINFDDIPLDEDLYGFTIKAFVRDTHGLNAAQENMTDMERARERCNRIVKLVCALVLLWGNIITQACLMHYTKRFVSKKAVHVIRTAYDDFEAHMYGPEASHFEITPNGYRRGLPQFFQPELFSTLDDSVKDGACSIPLSQPNYLMLILFIWSLTCFGELRRCAELFRALVIDTPSAQGDFVQLVSNATDDSTIYVRALRTWAKVVLTLFILVPRVLISILLLWLGNRWLLATNDFESLILNGVALTFVKDMKDLLYVTLVSAADKREVELTRIELPDDNKRLRTNAWFSVRSLLWGFVTLLFVYAYITRWQRVLPDYRWDVAAVCHHWLQTQFVTHLHV